MKKFFGEFKKFISRGNVMDMAVGMIIGAAFTAIVTALSDGILKPLINMVIFYICGGKDSDALSKMYTPLVKVWEVDAAGNEIVGQLDMAKSIYIDWGAFISAIINFLLVALVLFLIVKMFNKVREVGETASNSLKKESPFTKDELKALKKEGKTRQEIKALEEERRAQIAEEERIAAEEAAKNAPKTQEQLLQEIADLLRQQK